MNFKFKKHGLLAAVLGVSVLFSGCEMLKSLFSGDDSPKSSESSQPQENSQSSTTTKPRFGKKDTIHDTENWDIATLDTARNVDYLSAIEKDVVLEMNKARSNPKKYAELYIVPFSKKFSSDGTYQKKGVTMLTNEGVKVVNECIKVMSATAPMGLLKPEKGLSLAAQTHAKTQGQTNQTGHTGVDKSTPFTRIEKYGKYKMAGENISYGSTDAQEIIIQLLVDDGVSSRGHRKNILNKQFTQTGCGYSPAHKVYGSECVITYANGYVGE